MSGLDEDLMADRRTLFLSSDINEETEDRLLKQMLWLDSKGNGEIFLFVNSEGGEIDGAFAIYDCMQSLTAPITTIAGGRVISCATLILCAGARGRRRALPNSVMHMHVPSGEYSGTIGMREKMLDFSKMECLKLYKLISAHCGKTPEEVERACMEDTTLTPVQAKEWGMIDSVIEKF